MSCFYYVAESRLLHTTGLANANGLAVVTIVHIMTAAGSRMMPGENGLIDDRKTDFRVARSA